MLKDINNNNNNRILSARMMLCVISIFCRQVIFIRSLSVSEQAVVPAPGNITATTADDIRLVWRSALEIPVQCISIRSIAPIHSVAIFQQLFWNRLCNAEQSYPFDISHSNPTNCHNIQISSPTPTESHDIVVDNVCYIFYPRPITSFSFDRMNSLMARVPLTGYIAHKLLFRWPDE